MSDNPNADVLWEAALAAVRDAVQAGLPSNTRRAKLANVLEQAAATLRAQTRGGFPQRPTRLRGPMARLAIDRRRKGAPLKISFDRGLWHELDQPAALQVEVGKGGSVRLRPASPGEGFPVRDGFPPFLLVTNPENVPLAEGWHPAALVGGAIELGVVVEKRGEG
jgi:hypothetical protein